MPLHPSLVHLPIGVALVAPFVLAGLFVVGRSEGAPRGPWWVGAGLLAVVAVGCIAAGTTGESEAGRLLADPALRAAIEAHDDAAGRFTVAACVAAFVALIGGVLHAPRPRLVAQVIALVLALALIPLAVDAGRKGGLLVWEHLIPAQPRGPGLAE
jgi:uncharacterized membrane protein